MTAIATSASRPGDDSIALEAVGVAVGAGNAVCRLGIEPDAAGLHHVGQHTGARRLGSARRPEPKRALSHGPFQLADGPELPLDPFRTTGSDVVHMLRSGLRVRATPSTTTMVFCSSSNCGCVCMSNWPVTSKSWVKKPRHGDFVGRPVHDRLGDGAQRLREIRRHPDARHIARIEMHLRDAQIVARMKP